MVDIKEDYHYGYTGQHPMYVPTSEISKYNPQYKLLDPTNRPKTQSIHGKAIDNSLYVYQRKLPSVHYDTVITTNITCDNIKCESLDKQLKDVTMMCDSLKMENTNLKMMYDSLKNDFLALKKDLYEDK